ncbi:hypothetical protein GCM10009865_53290 [Aeromicrobium ponti]
MNGTLIQTPSCLLWTEGVFCVVKGLERHIIKAGGMQICQRYQLGFWGLEQ